MRRLSTAPLDPRTRPATSQRLRHEPLRALLDGVELGTWALGPRSIDELVDTVRQLRPAAVLEFGSGCSTVALAWAMRDVPGAGTEPRIVSLEQDPTQAERTRGLLDRAGLADEVAVLHAPLARQLVEGRETECYEIPAAVERTLGGRRVDLVVIDGPAGPPGIRFATLPLARPFVRMGARFVLDDALRDGELEVARRWAALPWATVDGIRLIEKGLLTGSVRG